MRPTETQLRHFKTFGYLGIPKVFGPEDMEWIIEEFEAAIQQSGGHVHNGQKRTMIGAPMERLQQGRGG